MNKTLNLKKIVVASGIVIVALSTFIIEKREQKNPVILHSTHSSIETSKGVNTKTQVKQNIVNIEKSTIQAKEKHENSTTSPSIDTTHRDLTSLKSVSNSPVIMESTSEKDHLGNYSLIKIVKTSFKYPYIRIIENFNESASGSIRLLNQSFMIADHLSIKLQDGVELSELENLASAQGYSVLKSYNNTNYALLSFELESTESIENAMAFLSTQSDLIAYAEMDHLRVLTSIVPDDSNFSFQGHLNYQRSPTNTLSTVNNIGAWQAWERRTDAIDDNGNEILIGIIDSSFHVDHLDLINNVWQNDNEIDGNGIDDDGNGFIDDINGWNFNTNSTPAEASSSYVHGTHVAGLVAAEGNNSIGVSGVAWRAKLVSAGIFGSGISTGSESAEAIRYLTDLGVDIMNASYGSQSMMQTECDAIQEAHAAGILFVTAAGNGASNLDVDGNDQYPAECDVDNIIVVGSGSTRDYNLNERPSNYGTQAVDIVAPYQTYSTSAWDEAYAADSYDYLEGTSMSSALVTGSAALLMAEYPELSNTEIKALLMDSATRSTPTEQISQSGMLNVGRAMYSDVATRVADVVLITDTSNDGNLPENAMDDDASTRWSAFGVGESITFELSDDELLSSLGIQWHKGDERAAKFSIESSLDGDTWEVIYGGFYLTENIEQSSASSAGLEYYPVLNVQARYVRIIGNGNTNSDWNSIVESEIHVFDESADILLSAPTELVAIEQNSAVYLTWNDNSQDESAYQIRRLTTGESGWENIAYISSNAGNYVDNDALLGTAYEYRVRAIDDLINGPLSNSAVITLESDSTDYDPTDEDLTVEKLTITDVNASSDDGNVAANTQDSSLDTRWSSLGDDQWIDFSLGEVKTITQVDISFHKGDQRSYDFILSVKSEDGQWADVYSGISDGLILLDSFEITPVQADTLRYTGYGNTDNDWNSLAELEIYGY